MVADSVASNHTPIQSSLSGVLPLLKVTLTRAEDSFIVDGDTLTEAPASATIHSANLQNNNNNNREKKTVVSNFM